jgi:hypothetical protein
MDDLRMTARMGSPTIHAPVIGDLKLLEPIYNVRTCSAMPPLGALAELVVVHLDLAKRATGIEAA